MSQPNIRSDFVEAVRAELAAQGRTVTDEQAAALVHALAAGAFAFEAEWSIGALHRPSLTAAVKTYFDAQPARDAAKSAAFGGMSEVEFLKLPPSERIRRAREAEKAASAKEAATSPKPEDGVKLSAEDRLTRYRAENPPQGSKERRAAAQRDGNARWQANGLRRLSVELSGAEVALSRSRDAKERSYLETRVADLKSKIATLKAAVPTQ